MSGQSVKIFASFIFASKHGGGTLPLLGITDDPRVVADSAVAAISAKSLVLLASRVCCEGEIVPDPFVGDWSAGGIN